MGLTKNILSSILKL